MYLFKKQKPKKPKTTKAPKIIVNETDAGTASANSSDANATAGEDDGTAPPVDVPGDEVPPKAEDDEKEAETEAPSTTQAEEEARATHVDDL